LRPSTSIDDLARELTKVLGFEVEAPKDTEDAKNEKNTKDKDKNLSLIARQQRIESWQSRWGLPRPSLVGLAAGTCAIFTIKDYEKIEPSQLSKKLSEIEASGIGERRAEGYGQICFNDPILTNKTSGMKAFDSNDKAENNQSSKKLSNSYNKIIFESDPTFPYARIIEKSAWREAINRASLFLAANPEYRYQILGIKIIDQDGTAQSKPTMSQLGALRSVITRLEEAGDSKVMQWLKNLKDTSNRLEKWDEGEKSLNILKELLSSNEKVWKNLTKALQELQYPAFPQLTLTQEGENNFKKELWTEAVNILVDACIRAHKRDLEKDSSLLTEALLNEAQGVE
jgi:CRISPR-associated protein Csx10